MKKKKQQDQTFLFEQIEKTSALDLEYADIQSRINLLQYEKEPAVKAPRYRLRPQVPVVTCALLLVTSLVGFGGFMMSRRNAVVEPVGPSVTETAPSPESLAPETLPPTKLPVLFPDDQLLWQGDVYVRTDLIVEEEVVGGQLGQVISEVDPQNPHIGRDDPHVAIADHLEDGTTFHQVTDTENYIAVHVEDGYVIYQRQVILDTATT